MTIYIALIVGDMANHHYWNLHHADGGRQGPWGPEEYGYREADHKLGVANLGKTYYLLAPGDDPSEKVPVAEGDMEEVNTVNGRATIRITQTAHVGGFWSANNRIYDPEKLENRAYQVNPAEGHYPLFEIEPEWLAYKEEGEDLLPSQAVEYAGGHAATAHGLLPQIDQGAKLRPGHRTFEFRT